MSNIFSMIVGVLLLLGAAAHVYRMCRSFAFIVGRYEIPRWYSLIFFAGEAYAEVTLWIMALT